MHIHNTRSKTNMAGSKSMKARASSSSISCCSSSVSFLMLTLLVLPSSIFSPANGKAIDEQVQQQQHMKPSWVKSVISLTDAAVPYTSLYLEKGRVVVKKVHGYFFRPTPDIDFRSRSKEGEGGKEATADDVIALSKVEKEGVGERVKEAASRSLEKSKSTLEESAKLASDALHEVTEKVKNTFLKHQDPPGQPEL